MRRCKDAEQLFRPPVDALRLYVLLLLFIPVVVASLEYEPGDAAMQCIDERLRDMGGCGVGGESETLGSTA